LSRRSMMLTGSCSEQRPVLQLFDCSGQFRTAHPSQASPVKIIKRLKGSPRSGIGFFGSGDHFHDPLDLLACQLRING